MSRSLDWKVREIIQCVSELEDFLVGSPHFRTRQCRGGLSSRSLHRMISQPQGDIPSLPYLGATYSRPVHHWAKKQGLAGEVPAGGLVEGFTVHVSPIAPPAPYSSQGDQGGRSGHRDSTVVALERMDSLVLKRNSLLLNSDGSEFSDLQELHLAAWCLPEAFRERLLPPHVQLIDHRCELYTTSSGAPFVTGVLDGRRIPFPCLSEWC